MKYHVVVFGCQMNTSDAERVAAIFEKMGFKKTENLENADIIAVVMCSVRQSAVDRVHWVAEKIKELKIKNPNFKAILTGCVLNKDKSKFLKNFDFVIDIKDIEKIPEFLARQTNFLRVTQAAKDGRVLSRKKFSLPSDYLEIKPLYSSKYTAHVPIMTGCNNFCSYCVVPYTRDREVSRPAKKIISEVKNLLKNGYKEIWLLGQNVNSYKDGKINFPKLLKTIDKIPGKFELNFTSSHPKDFSDELIEVMSRRKKLSKKLNLPIQSGDDEILKKMNRPYTIAQYKNLVAKIRKAIPDILLSTDIIVGFPGETKKQFENTVRVLKEIKYGVAFINKYSPREGTAAAKMKDNVSWKEKKRREKILIDLINKK